MLGHALPLLAYYVVLSLHICSPQNYCWYYSSRVMLTLLYICMCIIRVKWYTNAILACYVSQMNSSNVAYCQVLRIHVRSCIVLLLRLVWCASRLTYIMQCCLHVILISLLFRDIGSSHCMLLNLW